MQRPRIQIELILIAGLLLLLPTLATAEPCGGWGRCARATEDGSADLEAPDLDAPDLEQSCRREGGQGKGRADGEGYGARNGKGQGNGSGGQGNHAKMENARTLVHNHESIERTVEEIPGGVRTVTTSTDVEMVAVLYAHVAEMKGLLESGGHVRRWDPLFVEIFDHADEIDMEIQAIENGLEVTETSENPRVTQLIRAHANKISEIAAQGPTAAHQPTPVPVAAVLVDADDPNS